MMQRARLLALLAIAVVAGLLVTGCKDPMELTPDTVIASHSVPYPPEVFTIWAGQNEDAGDVTVWFDETTVYIKYQTTGNWWLEETHAHVALSLDGIPQKNGNPIPGKFEFSNAFNPRVQTHTYAIPTRDGWDCGVDLYIATHCVVAQLIDGKYKNRQTGWAGPYDFPGKNWALYIKYKRRCYKDLNMPTLPPPDSVKMAVYLDTVLLNDPSYKPKAHFKVALKDVPPGYEVKNAPPAPYWLGWCSEHAVGIFPSGEQPRYGIPPTFVWWYSVQLWSSQDPLLPPRPGMDNDAWDNVNYLLNHKLSDATVDEIQVAIWWLLTPNDPTLLPKYPLVGNSKVMHDEAVEYGDGWHPSKGQWLAIICDAPHEVVNGNPVQRVFIEVDP